MNEMYLDNWYSYGPAVCGDVYDNPKFTQGHPVRTSRIMRLDRLNMRVYTRNSVYRLATPLYPEHLDEMLTELETKIAAYKEQKSY